MTRGKDFNWYPLTSDELDAILAPRQKEYLKACAEIEAQMIAMRNIYRLPRRLNDDEFDNDQFSQENGNGFIY